MDDPCDHSHIIRTYLAADKVRQLARDTSIPAEEKMEVFRKVSSSFDDIEGEELGDLVLDKARLARLMNHTWFRREIELKYIGGWPGIGDLEKEWSQGSVVDIANQVHINRNSGKRHIKRIYEIIPIIDEVLALFPPIIVQGGEIREKSNLLFLPFDADDGSHRCIAAVLSGKDRIDAYVGMM